jgi:two-component system, OmpR family, response regulator ChvI
VFYTKNSLTSENGNSNDKRRILTVDDDPDITLTVKMGLEDSGLFQVDTFSDPELALSSFKPGLYDLVLLDFRMPKMYGHELYDEMKKIVSKIKVCFMTATYMNYEALRDAFPTIEIECYIQKPVKTKELISKINTELK